MNNIIFKRTFWLAHIALPLLVGLMLALVYPHTNLDAWLIQASFDSHTHVFPLKNDSFLENVMHKGLRNLMIIVSLFTLGLWLCGLSVVNKSMTLLSQKKWIQMYHSQFLWAFVAMVISTAAISALKHFSIHSCPWNLVDYGGTETWIPLFGELPAGATAGHCFPGGHASGGFALMAFYFAFRDSLPKAANIGLILGLVFGVVMGWAQMMRGAHFMSHNLWTAWIVWMILLAQYIVWPPKAVTRPVQVCGKHQML